jgi:hypothetical protein
MQLYANRSCSNIELQIPIGFPAIHLSETAQIPAIEIKKKGTHHPRLPTLPHFFTNHEHSH